MHQANAQGKRVNLDDDFEDSESAATIKAPIRPALVTKHALEYKFEDDSTWGQRGTVRLSKDG